MTHRNLTDLEHKAAHDNQQIARHNSARVLLIAIADDFQDDYLTVPRYAECNGLTESQARELIRLAQLVRASRHPEA